MTDKCLSECLGILEAMQSGQRMTAQLAQMYSIVLRPLEDREAMAAMEHIYSTEQWRPAPSQILDAAIAMSSPIPDADAAYDEIAHLAETVGMFGQRDTERPSIRLPGPPTFSHPLVGRIVQYCGGWATICSGEANMAEGLRKQVRSSWESVAREWRERVRGALRLPPEQRDPTLFRPYTPYRLPAGWEPIDAIFEPPAHAALESERTQPPDHLRGLIKRIGREMP